MLKIAYCESGFKVKAFNKNANSYDFGVFQVNSIHKPTAKRLGLNLADLSDNIAFGIHLYRQNGLKDWSASKKCWKNLNSNVVYHSKTFRGGFAF